MNLLDNGPTYSLLLSPTMIRSNLSPPPTYPATSSDLVPFLCANGYTLIFIALLVLLVEDDSNDSRVLRKQQPQLTSHQRRIIGLSEKEREWSKHLHSSCYGYSPVQRNVTVYPAFSHRYCLAKPLMLLKGYYLVRTYRTWSLFLI